MRCKRLTIIAAAFAMLLCVSVCGCRPNDGTTGNPEYATDGDGNYITFSLQLRESGGNYVTEDGDAYPHADIGGKLIAEWQIPVYGNTLYESVKKFCESGGADFKFVLSQHKFYMFDSVTANGVKYNLGTVYVAVDGKYANCANYQTLYGNDGVFGTDDDVKTVTLVHKGWLY